MVSKPAKNRNGRGKILLIAVGIPFSSDEALTTDVLFQNRRVWSPFRNYVTPSQAKPSHSYGDSVHELASYR